MKQELQKKIIAAIKNVKATNPMAPSMTNNVTIQFVANAQLAVGGAAAMTYLGDEGTALGLMGGALYINLGTLLPLYAETYPKAAEEMAKAGKPVVLDPVGIGMGDVRIAILEKMKDVKPAIIRGNASEIIALAHSWQLDEGKNEVNTRGVDTTDTVDAAKESAILLAKYTGGAVAISGEQDLITDGNVVVYSQGGSKFMPMITGAGCSLGGVMAIYATQTDPFTAAVTATNIYNLAGVRAEAKAEGPGSFYVHFLDELYLATPEEVAENPSEIEEI